MIEQAVVLAGGKGTRLSPLTKKLPKPLVPVANRPMLDYALELLEIAGIKKVIVVVKYLGEQIRDHLENLETSLEVVVPMVDPLDTADAVRKVGNFIDGDFVVSMADIITNLPIRDQIEFHERRNAFATMALKDVEYPQQRFGVIWLGEKGEIKLFLEKPRPEELFFSAIGFSQQRASGLDVNLVNTGIYSFNYEVLEVLNTAQDLMDFGRDVFPYLVQESYKVFGFVKEFYWLDAGNPLTYLWGNWDVLRRWAWPLMPYGNDNGGIWTGENTSIAKSAKIIPPVAIGDNVEIKQNSVVGPLSVIGSNSSIEEDAIVRKSVLLENVAIERGSEITQAIICSHSRISSGTRILPGAIIGWNVMVPPNEVVGAKKVVEADIK